TQSAQASHRWTQWCLLTCATHPQAHTDHWSDGRRLTKPAPAGATTSDNVPAIPRCGCSTKVTGGRVRLWVYVFDGSYSTSAGRWSAAPSRARELLTFRREQDARPEVRHDPVVGIRPDGYGAVRRRTAPRVLRGAPDRARPHLGTLRPTDVGQCV